MRNSQPYIRPCCLESIRVIIAENGESESYGVEDGGLFVEMVVTNEIDIRKRKPQEKILNSRKEKRFLASF